MADIAIVDTSTASDDGTSLTLHVPVDAAAGMVLLAAVTSETYLDSLRTARHVQQTPPSGWEQFIAYSSGNTPLTFDYVRKNVNQPFLGVSNVTGEDSGPDVKIPAAAHVGDTVLLTITSESPLYSDFPGRWGLGTDPSDTGWTLIRRDEAPGSILAFQAFNQELWIKEVASGEPNTTIELNPAFFSEFPIFATVVCLTDVGGIDSHDGITKVVTGVDTIQAPDLTTSHDGTVLLHFYGGLGSQVGPPSTTTQPIVGSAGFPASSGFYHHGGACWAGLQYIPEAGTASEAGVNASDPAAPGFGFTDGYIFGQSIAIYRASGDYLPSAYTNVFWKDADGSEADTDITLTGLPDTVNMGMVVVASGVDLNGGDDPSQFNTAGDRITDEAVSSWTSRLLGPGEGTPMALTFFHCASFHDQQPTPDGTFVDDVKRTDATTGATIGLAASYKTYDADGDGPTATVATGVATFGNVQVVLYKKATGGWYVGAIGVLAT